jgi:hypothetical protein
MEIFIQETVQAVLKKNKALLLYQNQLIPALA